MIFRFLVGCVFLANALAVENVHIFGDSHSQFCFGGEPSLLSYKQDNLEKTVLFNVHWLGARTMFSIGRDSLRILNIKDYGILDGDLVAFIFGEIDVRCHIGKQRDLRMCDLIEIIEPLVSNYLQTIIKNRLLLKNLRCVVISVVPPTNQSFNPAFPFYGALSDRIRITQMLNEKLREQCVRFGIFFLDIYPLYAKPDGSLDEKYSDGTVHIAQQFNAPIKKLLIEQYFANACH